MERKKKGKKDPSKWMETENRFVAYLDIMGFKERVARSTHKSIYEMMIDISETITDIKQNVIEYKGISDEIIEPIRTSFYSDSIMLFSRNDSTSAFYSLKVYLSILISYLFAKKIPFRGALALGKMTIDIPRSIYFGQPLIDAYKLEGELEMYAVVLHETIDKYMSEKESNEELLIEYACPFKGGKAIHLLVIPCDIFLENDLSSAPLFHEGIKKLRNETSGHLRKYIDNTQAFIDYVRAENKKEEDLRKLKVQQSK